MTSNGEYPSHGRARIPGNGYDASDPYSAYSDEYTQDSYGADPYPADSYGQPVARASVGTAAVGGPVEPTEPRPRYDWSAGQRAGSGAVSGRASVPVSPSPVSPGAVRGRASVPVSPGGPAGPGGPTGPNGRGGGPGRPPARRKKRTWIRNSALSALAVCVMLAGGAMVALSYYVDEVVPPEELELRQASRIYFSDGEEMAVLQEENRELINTRDLQTVQDAVVAAEDNKFWDHSGVDFLGIVRAAWNNFTGGEIQGASTITQQYARAAGNLHGQTYQRKLEEAAMAYKLSQEYDREEILDFYLNTVYFGRGAYGIEAAARAYFDVTAEELTVEQAALLAGIIRYPDDGSSFSPYDPLHTPDNPAVAVDRWQWVLSRMVAMGTLTEAEQAQMEMPEVIEPSGVESWHEGPQGPIVQQALYELEEMGITDVSTGGYRITLTIDPELQEAALRAADREAGGPLWDDPEDNVGAALVAIDPQTGAVLAYFGGHDGSGFDAAGRNKDLDGEWYGGRPPGSSFKIYTLVAALREDVSLDSHWKTSEFVPEHRSANNPIRNAGRVAHNCEGEAPDYCTLRWSTVQSYNVPFAYFSLAMGGRGPQAITQAAKDAGVGMMTGRTYIDGEEQTIVVRLDQVDDLGALDPLPFFHEVSFGQYDVTVFDHASGVATLAASGVYHKPHFVERVERRNETTGEWEMIAGDQIAGEQRIRPQIADAITGVLTAVPGVSNAALAGGRPAAAKTGTWEYVGPGGGNADAWMVGYTPQIAAAVWVGDPKGHNPIKYKWGQNIGSSGLPSHIWKQFMDEAHQVKGWGIEQFPQAPRIGNPQHAYANGELPEPDEDEDRCWPRFLCPDDDDDDDEDDGEGGGEGGGLGGEGHGDNRLPGREPED